MTSHDPDARVLAFDLDGTLAESKSAITPRMAGLLVRLLDEVQVCIISGGAFPQFQTQVLDYLDATPGQLAKLNLMPTNGTRYYLYRDENWREIYSEDLPEATKRTVIDVLTEGAKTLGLWEEKTWGDIVEDRGSQITFSALGQQAPVPARTPGTRTARRRSACAPGPPSGCPAWRSAAAAPPRSTSPRRASTRPTACAS